MPRPLTPRTRLALWLTALVAIAAAAFAGYRLWAGPAVEIVRPVRQEIVQTVVSSGRVLPPAEITLDAFVAGAVTRVLATEGQQVDEDALLAELDDRELGAAVRQAEAAVARARAGTAQVTTLSLPAAKERLRQAELAAEQARRELERDSKLFSRGAITAAALEQSRTAVDLAESQKTAARLQVAAATGRGSEALGAAAALEQAEAQLAAAKASLAHTRVQSPVEGTVLERYIEPGDSVQPGMRLFVISGTGNTRLVIEPDERNLALLELGQHAVASAEAFPKDRFEATVSFIAPSVDAQRGTVEVRLAVPEPPPYLRPDMTVSVEVTVASKDNALVLPSRVVRDLATEHPWVLTVGGDQRVARQPIRVGVRGDEVVEVVEGVSRSTAVIADPAFSAEPGSRVRPQATGAE